MISKGQGRYEEGSARNRGRILLAVEISDTTKKFCAAAIGAGGGRFVTSLR